MRDAWSYRESHKYAGKGDEYETLYAKNPWQKFLWAREQEVLAEILREFCTEPEVDLLDFACGTGRITSFLESRVARSTGIDVSPEMLSKAKEKLTKTDIIEADLTSDDVLAGRTFNLVTAFRFFLNAEPALRSEVIKTLSQLLSEDGVLVFNNHHNSGCPWVKLADLRRRQSGSKGIYNMMSIGQMHDLANEAGLEIVTVYPTGFFHPPRIPVSLGLNQFIDRRCRRIGFLQGYSENLIAVCRKSGSKKEQNRR